MKGMNGQAYVILAIILVIIIAVFAVINVDPVSVNYLFWTQESPLILVILFSVLMGGVITGAVGAIRLYRVQHELKRLRAENERLQKQLESHGITYELSPEQSRIEARKEKKKEAKQAKLAQKEKKG